MSQQMFEPEESQQQKRRTAETSRRNHKTHEMPKNEHPATFEEPFATTFPYATPETIDNTPENQDGEKITYQEGYTGRTDGNNGRFSPDGDAMELGYRPYNAYRPSNTGTASYVPPWARPQQHHSVMRVLGTVIALLVAVMLLIKVIIPLLLILFAFAAIVIVFISVALLVFGLFIVGFLRLLGIRIPLRPSRLMRRGRA